MAKWGKERGSLYIRGIPNAVKTDFKAWCARNNVTMTEAVVDLLKKVVQGQTKPAK